MGKAPIAAQLFDKLHDLTQELGIVHKEETDATEQGSTGQQQT